MTGAYDRISRAVPQQTSTCERHTEGRDVVGMGGATDWIRSLEGASHSSASGAGAEIGALEGAGRGAVGGPEVEGLRMFPNSDLAGVYADVCNAR